MTFLMVSMTLLLTSGTNFCFSILFHLSIVYSLWFYKRKCRGPFSLIYICPPNSSMAFVLKGEQSQVITPGRPPQKFPKERPYCTSCHAPGHTIDTCYKIHGYPPGYKGRPKYAPRNTPATVNQTSGISSSLEGTVPSVPPVFDKLQMDQLMAMFAQHLSNADKKGGSHDDTSTSHVSGICLSVSIPRLLNSPSIWIVDSGASRHISSNINAFIFSRQYMIQE